MEYRQANAVGITYGDNDQTIMNAYIKKYDINDVTLVGVRFDYTPFLKRSVDLFPVYRNTQGVDLRRQLEQEHEAVSFFDPSGPEGINFVANSIITSSKMVKEHPDIVQRFVSATLKGWNKALELSNSEQTVRALISRLGETERSSSDQLAASVAEQLRVTREFVLPPEDSGIRLGEIDLSTWEETEDVMREAGLFDSADGKRPKAIKIAGFILRDVVGHHE